ncbi:MAG: hypothetical protein GXY83_11145, partial [Rhodopirellula sp.]|nr:hypothetical protein [Rhodopirellula sp.]
AFSVLFITTHPHRRDAAAKAISKMKGADLWLFISQTDLKPEAFLFEPITYNCKGEAGPLVRATQGNGASTSPNDAPAVANP